MWTSPHVPMPTGKPGLVCVLWWLIKLIATRIFQGPSCVFRYGSELLLFSYFSGAWVQIVTLCKIVIALCKKPFGNVAQRSSNSIIKGQSFQECVILTTLHIVWSVNDGAVETHREPSAVLPNISSIVEFQRWWVLKSTIFAQESTCLKEILISTSLNDLWFLVDGG